MYKSTDDESYTGSVRLRKYAMFASGTNCRDNCRYIQKYSPLLVFAVSGGSGAPVCGGGTVSGEGRW